MKTLKPTFAAVAWLCCIQFLSADTIVLKNGEKIEGRVIREVDGIYTIEVMVSRTIRDEKKIPVGDVAFIDKEGDDTKAFKEIEKFVPTPELLPESVYESRIEKIEAFINAHPESGKVAKAKEMYDYLSEELAVIREGGIKFGEEMVAAEDYMANAYEYDATIEGNLIKEAVARREFLAALRAFTKYERIFTDAPGRDEIAGLIKQVLGAYQSSIDASLSSLDSRIEKRQAGLSSMTPDDRAQTERALADEEARISARFAAEKEAKEEWVTPDAFHKESLDEARRQADSETKRLETGKVKVLEVPVAETYRLAWGKLAAGTEEEKKAVLEDAKKNGLPEPYLVKLRERAGIAAP